MSKFILALLINIFLGLILYFIIGNYPEFIYPAIAIESVISADIAKNIYCEDYD